MLRSTSSEIFKPLLQKMRVYPIPCLKDNYAYLLVDESTKEAAAVDPVEPTKVIQKAQALNVEIKMLLTTHHHWDHASGNPRFIEKCKVPVVGGDERIEALSDRIQDGEIRQLGNIRIKAISTPCHTKGSISYFCSSDNQAALFSGDTLFIAGCGRFFEGDAATMYQSLSKLADLPKHTEVYCGHEYTYKDLKFAETVEPNNKDIKSMLQQKLECTVPTSLETVLLINPFLRLDSIEIQKAMNTKEPIDLMHRLREKKNAF